MPSFGIGVPAQHTSDFRLPTSDFRLPTSMLRWRQFQGEVTVMPISEATYRRVALEDTDSTWERWCGRLVEKPIMTTEHNETARNLLMMLAQQLPHGEYSVG